MPFLDHPAPMEWVASASSVAGRAGMQVARAPRYTLEQAARLRIGSCMLQLRTIDISCGGAKLDIQSAFDPKLFRPNTVVLLTVQGMAAPRLARVRWQLRDQIGLQFNDPLGVEEIKRIRVPARGR